MSYMVKREQGKAAKLSRLCPVCNKHQDGEFAVEHDPSTAVFWHSDGRADTCEAQAGQYQGQQLGGCPHHGLLGGAGMASSVPTYITEILAKHVEREAELLGRIEDLELQVCRLKHRLDTNQIKETK